MYMITGSPLCSNQLVSIGRITAEVEDHVPSRHLSQQIARLVRRMTYTAPNQRPGSSDAAQLASDIISDDREWIVLELFAAAPPFEGLLLNDAADTLFNKFAEREHWLNRTDARFKTILQILKDMYHAGKLIRRGHRYFLT